MSIRRSGFKRDYSLAGKQFNPTFSDEKWVRNPSWLSITEPASNEQKFVGLYAVYPQSNFVALSAEGNYTVNWGDGTIENFNSGVTAYHEYDYTDSDLIGTEISVNLVVATSTVERNSHGYKNGMEITFNSIADPSIGVFSTITYFVVEATTNTFRISETKGGTPISFSVADTTATVLPYRQAVVTVTMQSGQTFTSLNLNRKHNKTNLQSYSSGFLDIAISGPNLTDLRIGATYPDASLREITFNNLENVKVVNSKLKNLNQLLSNCSSLKKVVIDNKNNDAPSVLNVTFTPATDRINANSHGLSDGDSVYLTDVVVATGSNPIGDNVAYWVVNKTANDFQLSISYNGPPITFDITGTGKVHVADSMVGTFANCYRLTEVDMAYTGNVVNMTSMFLNCSSIKTIPYMDTSYARETAYMFSGCSRIKNIPLFKTTSVWNMEHMFADCTSLEQVPLYDTQNVESMRNMFSGCYSLSSIPLFNTSGVLSMDGTFQNCASITTIPKLDLSSIQETQNMFSGCRSLREIPTLNTSSSTNMSNMFLNCSSLSFIPTLNLTNAVDVSYMFSGCSSIRFVPILLINSATNAEYMFYNCTSLEYANNMYLPLCTNFNSMFESCKSIKRVGEIYTDTSTTLVGMYRGCSNLSDIRNVRGEGAISTFGYESMFANCPNLSSINNINLKYSFSLQNCKLSGTALNTIYTALPSVSGQTITVTGNHGTDTHTPSIATAKGWTVVA